MREVGNKEGEGGMAMVMVRASDGDGNKEGCGDGNKGGRQG
jgi:hypothetical protein